MSIFDLFRWNVERKAPGPDIKFGRYSDTLRAHLQQDYFLESIEQFESNNHLQSMMFFLDFLRDDQLDNVAYDQEGNELFFKIIQGSKEIIGRCNQEKIVAIAELAKLDAPNVGLFRKLLDRNYQLKYCRFGISEDQILSLKYDSLLLDNTPQKMYHALRELAINADKYDDLIVHEFDHVSELKTGRIIEQSEAIKQVKIDFLRSQIQEILTRVSKEEKHSEQFHIGISYQLLNCNYKLDYLVKPEGGMLEILERNHRLFFADQTATIETRNEQVIANFNKILELTDQVIAVELYDTIHSYSHLKQADHRQLQSLIDNELPKVNEYFKTKNHIVAKDIIEYIASYSLFYFGLPAPDKDLLHLLLHIFNQAYFIDLGFDIQYIKNEQLKQKTIVQEIKAIRDRHEKSYPAFKPNYKILRFENLLEFGHSFLTMIRSYDLNYTAPIVSE